MREMGQILRRHWGLFASGVLALFAYSGLVTMHWRFGTLRDGHVPETIRWYLLAFAAFITILVWAEKRPIPMRWVWLFAVIFRLMLLLTRPTLSDDVYRYLWDGHVANNGVTPYAYPINAAEVDYLDNPVREQANNTWMASPYLPVSQWVFKAITAILPLDPLYLQFFMVLFDLLSAWIVAQLLVLASLPPHRLLLYLWNPLVILEVAHGAHIDAWMVLLSLLAVWTTLKPAIGGDRSRSLFGPLFLALATLTKILPVLLLPVLFWRWHWRQRVFYLFITVALLLPSGIRAGWGLTGLMDGRGLFGALRIYAAQWYFNAEVFHWLEQTLGSPDYGAPLPEAKHIVLLLMLVVMTIVWWLARGIQNPPALLRLMGVPIMAYVLLTPVVHPWYLLLLIAFLPFLPPATSEPRRLWLLALPWIYLSGILIFSYLAYLDPANFIELDWVRQLEWLPALVLLSLIPAEFLTNRVVRVL